MIERFIPPQLQNDDFRFLKIRMKGKEPTADMGSWQEKNFQYNDTELLNHLIAGGNYGIIGGYGNLVLIDSDSEEIEKLCKTLPETFTVKTGSPEEYKKHYLYTAEKKIKPIRLSKEGVGDLGDVRSVGQYVVAPTSIHPSGGEYKVIKDIPIAKVSEKFIRSIFKEYIDKTDSTNFKEFPIETKKRSSEFIRECRVPDYAINNKMKGGTSKNWKLFPYLVDILHNREVTQSVYVALCKRQGHNVGAIKGWVKKAHEGKLAKTSCEKMQDYLKRFHPDLIGEICGGCPLYKKETKKRSLKIFTDRITQAEEFIKSHPFFYDKNKIWWVWDFDKFCYEMTDEIDILNKFKIIDENIDIVNSKIRQEIINACKQVGRNNIPEEPKESWIQFKNKIYDLETENIIETNPKYFITNPIKWEMGKSEKTPALDILFDSWVGEEHKEELYELLAFCLIPNYFIHRTFCLIGSGANGKSTFLKILENFIGEENITSSSLFLLLKQRFEGSKLFKKLVCLIGETSFDLITNTDYLKKLTGEDLVRAEFKGKNGFDFRNYAKLIMATNSLPPTADKTDGFYRRWKIQKFPNKFYKEINVLFNILDEEYENLALKCFKIAKKLWVRRTFLNEGNFEDRKRKYEDESNPLMKYVLEEYIKEINGETLFQEFFDGLNIYLEERGHRLLSAIAVSKQLKAESFEIKTLQRGNINGRFIIGLKPKNELY